MRILADPKSKIHGSGSRRGLLGFLAGFALGLIGGSAGLLLFLLGHAAQQPLRLTAPVEVQADIVVSIHEDLLNRNASAALQKNPIALSFISVSGLELDVQPQRQLRLKPTFHTALVDGAATVTDRIDLEDGQLALHMVGDPQIENIAIPLGMLPFDLPKQVRDGIERINNEVLSAELNRQLQASFGSGAYRIQSITTDDSYLTFHLVSK